jgi:SET domain
MKHSTSVLTGQLELRPSRIDLRGVGVFAVSCIKQGEKIADGVADEDFESLVPWREFRTYDAKVQSKVMAFCIGTPDGFVPPPDNDFDKLSIEWYLNHSCEGNCGFDSNGDFTALRNIGEGEEICYDYALIETNPQFSMRCGCGGVKCRHLVTGNDWKNEDFVAKHREYMHPRLRRLLPVHA